MNNKSKWDSLTLKEKSDIIKMHVESGISDLNNIKINYNYFASGGSTEEPNWLMELVADTAVWGASKVMNSKLLPEKSKKRILELTMRLSGGNSDEGTKLDVAKYLASKEGMQLVFKTLTEDTPVDTLIAQTENEEIENYGGFALPSDILDPDVKSFYEQHPGDADFVTAYSQGVVPFESAGVYKVDDSDPHRLGRYESYINKEYNGKYIPVYQGHSESLDLDLIKYLNEQSYLKNTSTFGVNSGGDLPFEFGYNREESTNPNTFTQGYYDAAGYNLELIRGEDGKIYGRKSDMYDFMPKHYVDRYTPEGNDNMKNLVKTIDALGNPFIFRGPWFEVNDDLPFRIPDSVLDEFNHNELDNKKNKHNSFAAGGPTEYPMMEDVNPRFTPQYIPTEEEKYVPATAAGFIAKITGADEKTQAAADIGSAAANLGADNIPIIGNIVGIGISALDTVYDLGKLIYDPSWKNLGDLGTSALSMLPYSSVKEIKTMTNALKYTGGAKKEVIKTAIGMGANIIDTTEDITNATKEIKKK